MEPQQHQHKKPNKRLAIMAVLSFVAMFALMHAMVDRFANAARIVGRFT